MAQRKPLKIVLANGAKPAPKRRGGFAKRDASNRKGAYASSTKPSAKRTSTAVVATRATRYPKIPRSIFSELKEQAFIPFCPAIQSWHAGTLPRPGSLGHNTYVRSGHEFYHQSGTTTETDFFVICWTPSSSKVWKFVNNGTCNEMRHQILDNSPPMQIAPGRCGVRLMNIGKTQDVGGLVSVYHSYDPLQLNLTASTSGQVTTATIASLKALMTDSAKVRKYTGAELTAGKEFFIRPASHVAYQEWHTYRDLSQSSVNEALALTLGLQSQGTSNVVIAIHDNAQAQNYQLQIISEDYCRYSGNTLGAAAARPPVGVTDVIAYNRAAAQPTVADR